NKKKWRFSCTECGYKCVKKSTLKKHSKKHEMRSIEEIVLSKQVMCELCGKMVKSKNSLKVHMQSHSGEKFPCSHCEKVYNSKYSLNDHARIHTGEKNKECPDCGKKFLEKNNWVIILEEFIEQVINNFFVLNVVKVLKVKIC
ncbi:unnamed protein product, partial [Meganyctiphanes norvegica]